MTTPEQQRQEMEALLHELHLMEKGRPDETRMMLTRGEMRKVLEYLRSLQAERDTLLRDNGEMRANLTIADEALDAMIECPNNSCHACRTMQEHRSKNIKECLSSIPDRSVPPKA